MMLRIILLNRKSRVLGITLSNGVTGEERWPLDQSNCIVIWGRVSSKIGKKKNVSYYVDSTKRTQMQVQIEWGSPTKLGL